MEDMIISAPGMEDGPEINVQAPGTIKRNIMEFKGQVEPTNIHKQDQQNLTTLRQNYNKKDTRRAKEVVATVENTYNSNSDFFKSFGSKKQRREAEAKANITKQHVVDELYSQGYENPRYEGNDLFIDYEGQTQKVDSSFMEAINASKFEIAGSMAGASAGAAAGAVAGTTMLPGMGTALGAVAGGMIGAYTGKGADILVNNMKTIEDIDDKLVFAQMEDAGIADAVFSAMGTGAMKVAVKSGSYLAKTVAPMGGKSISNLVSLIKDKNINGAVDYAKRFYNISDKEAVDMVSNVEAKIGTLRGSAQEKFLQTIAFNKPGGEELAIALAKHDPVAANNMVREVSSRAAQLKASIGKLNKENVLENTMKDLDNYTTAVADMYSSVKKAPAEFTKHYSFDYDTLGIKPILETIGERVEDPIVKERFLNILNRAGDVTESRGFTDLIDLRQEVNYLLGKPGIRYNDKAALLNTLKTIDNEIDSAADLFIPSADKWKSLWKEAKGHYSEMLSLEDNVLYKGLTKAGNSPTTTVNILSKYITAGDDTFKDVMKKLKPSTRSKIDNAILDKLVNKYTLGDKEGMQAIDFLKLSKDLKSVPFTNPKAKQQVDMIHNIADIYINDPNLAQATGVIPVKGNTSLSMATNVATKSKLEAIKILWGSVRQFLPGDTAKSIALTRHMAKIFENPTMAKDITRFKGILEADKRVSTKFTDFKQVISELQQDFIARKEVYKQFMTEEEIAKRPDILWGPSDVLGASKIIERDSAGNIINMTPAEQYGILRKGKVVTETVEAGKKPSSQFTDIGNELHRQIYEAASNNNITLKGNVEKFVANTEKGLDSKLRTVANNTDLSPTNVEGNIAKVEDIMRQEAQKLKELTFKNTGATISDDAANKLIRAKFAKLVKECME